MGFAKGRVVKSAKEAGLNWVGPGWFTLSFSKMGVSIQVNIQDSLLAGELRERT